jgi:hypothetical protein
VVELAPGRFLHPLKGEPETGQSSHMSSQTISPESVTAAPRQQPGVGLREPRRNSDILVLSSSLLTDRMFLHTRFLKVLSEAAQVRVWATSARNSQFQRLWSSAPAVVEKFPQVRAFKVFPYDYLRRLNEFVWDFRQRPVSRLSMWRHVRSKDQQLPIRALQLPASLLAMMKMEEALENRLENLLLNYCRSDEALERLQAEPPAVLLTTGPFQFEQPAVIAVAKKLGIPVLALIPSWDNLSTKNRMVFKYDGYLVWSEQGRRELHHFYPHTREVPVYVIGAPQFDVFSQERFYQSREEFCATQGLRPELPIILYAVGSPNFLREHHGAVDFAGRVMRGELGEVQCLVRPHPIHDNQEMVDLFSRYAPRVVLQQTAEAGTALTARSQDESQIVEWVNTFRHADVVVNLSSTVTVDAAIFDRPIVNIDYDPEPGQPNQALIKDVNHLWTHFKPVAESGGVWLADSPEEMMTAVKTYLEQPELHREQRRWIADYVCEYVDGKCGERMAEAILDFTQHHTGVRSTI